MPQLQRRDGGKCDKSREEEQAYTSGNTTPRDSTRSEAALRTARCARALTGLARELACKLDAEHPSLRLRLSSWSSGPQARCYRLIMYLDLSRAYSLVGRCGPEQSQRNGKRMGTSCPTSRSSRMLHSKHTAATVYHGFSQHQFTTRSAIAARLRFGGERGAGASRRASRLANAGS